MYNKTFSKAVILAESKEEAIEKFKSTFGDYENARISEGETYIDCREEKSGIIKFI